MRYTIIDYGMGNLHSVKNALEFLKKDAEITSDAQKIKNASAIILPGVGAFPDAIRAIKDKGIFDVIIEKANEKTPLLGICLGMQLLLSKSYENGECEGLNLIEGECVKIKADGLKIPHIGWNDLTFLNKGSIMNKNLKENSYVYFVHSYRASLSNRKDLTAYTLYGEEIPAIIERENIFGCQFHPEKSERVGLCLLSNFCDFCEK